MMFAHIHVKQRMQSIHELCRRTSQQGITALQVRHSASEAQGVRDTGFRVRDFSVLAHDACSALRPGNLRLIARCIVEWEGRILLCRRAEEPRRGCWSIPGGFREPGERLDATAARETHEETGATIGESSLLFVYVFPQRNEIVVIFSAKIGAQTLAAGAESLEVQFFEKHGIPWADLAFPTDSDALSLHLQQWEHSPAKLQLIECFWDRTGRILAR